MKTTITLTLLTLFIISCTVESKPIQYGTDQCTFCKMTIVDKSHGAQVVTKKGRVHNFDAIECMIDYLKNLDESTLALTLTPDFNRPGTLVDAKNATFIVSKQIPSPMGAFISSFANKGDIDSLPEEVEVKILTWNEVRDAR